MILGLFLKGAPVKIKIMAEKIINFKTWNEFFICDFAKLYVFLLNFFQAPQIKIFELNRRNFNEILLSASVPQILFGV